MADPIITVNVRFEPSRVGFLAANQQGGVVGRAVERGAGKVAQRARDLAPVDTGELRSSIKAEPVVADASRSAARVEATAGHAYYQERGTSRHRAQPYLVPALDELSASDLT